MVRVPMIRFRYGIRDAIAAATGEAAATDGPVYVKASELPSRFRMKQLSEVDIMRIQVCVYSCVDD